VIAILYDYIKQLMEIGLDEKQAIKICGIYACDLKSLEEYIKINKLLLDDRKQYPKEDN
jgi:hypothetical protein